MFKFNCLLSFPQKTFLDTDAKAKVWVEKPEDIVFEGAAYLRLRKNSIIIITAILADIN